MAKERERATAAPSGRKGASHPGGSRKRGEGDEQRCPTGPSRRGVGKALTCGSHQQAEAGGPQPPRPRGRWQAVTMPPLGASTTKRKTGPWPRGGQVARLSVSREEENETPSEEDGPCGQCEATANGQATSARCVKGGEEGAMVDRRGPPVQTETVAPSGEDGPTRHEGNAASATGAQSDSAGRGQRPDPQDTPGEAGCGGCWGPRPDSEGVGPDHSMPERNAASDARLCLVGSLTLRRAAQCAPQAALATG